MEEHSNFSCLPELIASEEILRLEKVGKLVLEAPSYAYIVEGGMGPSAHSEF